MIPRESPDQPERAATSTIGTLLVTAFVFLLAVGAMAGAFTIGVTPPPVAPQATFGFDFTNDGSADSLEIRHAYGESIPGSDLQVVVSGASPPSANGEYRWSGPALAGDGRVDAGSSVTLDPGTTGDGVTLDLDGATVSVSWHAPDRDHSTMLDRWEGPTSASTPTPTSTPAPTPTPTPDPSDPGHAYVDENGNGVWDGGTDTKIDDSAITDGVYDAGADALVIPESVGPITASRIDFDGASVTVEVDLSATGNQDVSIRAGSGVLDVEGIRIDSASGRQITLRGESGVRANGTTVDSGAAITVASNSGETHLSGATLDATETNGANIQLTSRGDLYLESTDVTTTAGGSADADLQVEDTSTISVEGATIADGDATLEVAPEDITIDGTPASGSVTNPG